MDEVQQPILENMGVAINPSPYSRFKKIGIIFVIFVLIVGISSFLIFNIFPKVRQAPGLMKADSDMSKWQVYTVERDNYSVRLPPKWTGRDGDGVYSKNPNHKGLPYDGRTFFEPHSGSGVGLGMGASGSLPTMSIIVIPEQISTDFYIDPANNTKAQFDEWLTKPNNSVLSSYNDQYRSVKKINVISIGDKKGIEFQTTISPDGKYRHFEVKTYSSWFNFQGYNYYFSISGQSTSAVERYLPAYYQILSSFTLLKKTETINNAPNTKNTQLFTQAEIPSHNKAFKITYKRGGSDPIYEHTLSLINLEDNTEQVFASESGKILDSYSFISLTRVTNPRRTWSSDDIFAKIESNINYLGEIYLVRTDGKLFKNGLFTLKLTDVGYNHMEVNQALWEEGSHKLIIHAVKPNPEHLSDYRYAEMFTFDADKETIE